MRDKHLAELRKGGIVIHRLTLLAVGVCTFCLAIGLYRKSDAEGIDRLESSQPAYAKSNGKTPPALRHIGAPRSAAVSSTDAGRNEYLKEYSLGSLDFWQARKSIHREQIRAELLSTLYRKSPDYFAFAASATLTDPSFLEEHFGKDQSSARMFAIECMVYLLKLENYDVVLDTIGGVSTLHRNAEGFPRVDLDLEYLVYEYVKANPDRFFGAYENQLSKMGLDMNNRMIFSDSVLMALKGKPEYSSELSDFIHD